MSKLLGHSFSPSLSPGRSSLQGRGERSSLLGRRESQTSSLLGSTQFHSSLTSQHVFSGDGISWWKAAFILSNITIGVGVLNFPSAYHHSGGIISALLIQIVCVVGVVLSLVAICHCADLCNKDTYQEVVEYYIGRAGLYVCNVCIFLHNLGVCVSMLIIIADQLDTVISMLYGSTFCHTWYMNRSFTLTIAAICFILPPCFSKTIDSFIIGSIIGILSTFYVIVMVIMKYNKRHVPAELITWSPDWLNMANMLPAICFSYEGHVEAVPIYACLSNRNLKDLAKIAVTVSAGCAIIYNLVGIYGYLGFGAVVNSDVLASFNAQETYVQIGLLFTAVKAITTYPVIFFCVRMVIENFWNIIDGRESCQLWTEKTRRYFLTIVIFLISLILAQFSHSMGIVISMLGATGALFMFIFPGICYIQCYYRPKYTVEWWLLLCGVCFVTVGVFIAALSVTQSIQKYLHGDFTLSEVICVD